MSQPPPEEPFDWADMIDDGTRTKARKRARMRASAPQSFNFKGQTKGKAPRKLGVLGWLIVLTCFIIFAAGATLFWISWSFNSNARTAASDARGEIPISRDFSPNRVKPSDVLFRIGGSGELGNKLMPDLVSNWMRARGFTGITVSENDRIVTVRGGKGDKDWRVLIARGSAQGGFEALIGGRLEAVMSSRQILPEEADRLSALGDMTSSDNEKAIGLTASLVLVNRANLMTNISSDTLARILSGDITDWSDIAKGGTGKIEVKLEGKGADQSATPAGRLLGDRELPENVELLDGPDAVAAAVGNNPRAIGLAERVTGGTRALTLNERNARAIDPDPFMIATESYPFTQRIFVYVGSSGRDPMSRDFAAYAISPAGQEIVARTGYVPLKLAPVKGPVPVGAPPEYANFARDAMRMNFDIRFHEGANALDARSEDDLRRFVDYIAKNQIDKRRIALLGFADNVGARATNLGLAQSRAETVGIELERLGISPGIIRSYGDALPVAANAEEQGRIRNRRVEVWLCAPPACPLVDLSSQSTSRVGEIPSGVRLGPPGPTPPGEEAPKG